MYSTSLSRNKIIWKSKSPKAKFNQLYINDFNTHLPKRDKFFDAPVTKI